MHAKCIHELCSLLPHIPLYLHHISMYLDVFGDFQKDPPYFGYNSAGQETPVLCIFSFQGPIRTQIGRGFFEDHYFPKYDDTKL